MKRQKWIQLSDKLLVDPYVVEAVQIVKRKHPDNLFMVRLHTTSNGYYTSPSMTFDQAKELRDEIKHILVPE